MGSLNEPKDNKRVNQDARKLAPITRALTELNMSNEKKLLTYLASKGKPFAEVVVIPKEGEDIHRITDILDSLADDIAAEICPAYFQFDEDNLVYELRLDATKESLLREFGWHLEREKYYDTKEDSGQYPDAYAWKELNKPQFYPAALQGRIERMGLTQPGRGDNGSEDNVQYEQ
tara:strand:+ start:8254 stop:8778 length:525 start_codon:yes stop_codon:yes gene_type:complete